MSSASRVPGGARRSWRDTGGATDDPRAARQVRRVVWTVLGTALLACFAWFAFRMIGPQPATYIAAAAVTEYKLTAATPLPFARQSIDGLKDIDSIEFLSGGEGATSEAQLTAWLERLKAQPLRADDVLIVYLAAHGVSANDRDGNAKAYLLASNYDPPKNNLRPLGVVELDAVITALAACRGATKLLVLDAGSVERDWALGAAVNEFPQLLADKLRLLAEGGDAKVDISGLWVLSSHDLFEKSHAAYADRQGVFAHFVAQGLSGEADKKGDGLDLAELYEYVRERVARYVWQASGGRETQTPQLLSSTAAGERTLAAAAQVRLVRQRRQKQIAGKGGAESKDAPKAGDAPPTAALGSPLPLAMLYAGNAPQSKEKVPGDEKASDAKDDQPAKTPVEGDAEVKSKPTADAQSHDGKTAPADDAPDKPAKTDAATEKEPDEPFLTALSEQWAKCHELADRSSQVWTTIDYAPHRWLQWAEKLKGYEQRWLCGVSSDPKQLAGLAGDLDQEHRRLRQSASDLPLALDRAQQHQQLLSAVQLRNDLLARLRYYFESPLVVGPDAANIDAVLDGLPQLLSLLRGPSEANGAAAVDAWLADLQAACQRLQGPMSALEDSFAARFDSDDPTTLAAVLELPWLEAQKRLKLLMKLNTALPLSAKPTENEIVVRSPAWKRAVQLARWQAKWLQLAGTPDESLEKLLMRLSGASSDQAELRQAGARLAALRGSLASGLGDAGDPAARASAANRLRLLDGRIDIAADLESDPILRDQFPKLDIPWKLKLVRLSKGSPITLSADDELRIEWRIDADPPRAMQARWKATISNPSQLLLDATEGTVALTGSRDQVLTIKVQAAKNSEAAAKLTLEIEAGERSDHDMVELRTRPLEPVELLVDAFGPDGTQELLDGDPNRRILRPIATGRTTFRLSLNNSSRRPREIEYRLLAFTAAGFLPVDLEGRLPTIDDVLPRGMKELHGQTVKLAAGEAKPLPLAAAAKAASDAKNPPPANGPPSAPPKGQPIEALVLEVREPAAGTTQHFWMALEPLHPRRYLRPVARYDFEKRQVEIDFSPIDASRLPPEGSAIDWGYGEGKLVPPQKQLHASIIPPKNLGDRTLEVLVAADGYPRAFRYDLRCDGPRGTQLPRDDFDLRLLSPAADQRVWLKKGQPATVRLAADFPKERSGGKASIVRVEIESDTGQTQPRAELRADRRATFVMMPEAEDGLLAIETTVDDLEVSFPTDAYQDQDLRVLATLGNRQVPCNFTLDTRPPTIDLDRLPVAGEGQELRVSLRAMDEGSGVKKVELALDPDDTGEWKMPVAAQPAAGGDSGSVWEAVLPTGDKKSYRAGTVSQFLAKATDEAGNSPERPQRFEFRVVAEKQKTAMPPGAEKKADLKVTVTFGDAPAAQVDVVVSGPKSWQGKTDGRGQFTLRALPAGAYKIHIQGFGRASTPLESDHELTFDPTIAPVQSQTIVSKVRRRQ